MDAPEDYLFGRPTSVETVTEYGADNVDRSKNTALIPPAFGSPTSYLPNTGEPLTPNLIPGALSGGLVSSVGSVGSVSYPAVDSGSSRRLALLAIVPPVSVSSTLDTLATV